MARIADQAEAEWVYDIGPCDCCPLASGCKKCSHACEQFLEFFRFGGRRWRSAAREPSVEIYHKVFKEAAEEQLAE